jgi:hypothetical protein
MRERNAEEATPDRASLENFFVRYGEAVSAGDLKIISACYAVPAIVLSDTGSIPIATREEVEAAFDGAAQAYRAQGMVAARPTVLAAEALTEKLLSVDVRWDYLDEEGRRAERLPLRAQVGGGRAANVRANSDSP